MTGTVPHGAVVAPSQVVAAVGTALSSRALWWLMLPVAIRT